VYCVAAVRVDEGVALGVGLKVAVGMGVEVDEWFDSAIWLSMKNGIDAVKTNTAIKMARIIALDFFIAFLLALLIYMQIDKNPFVNPAYPKKVSS
jgi:hypothetical protein